MQLQLRVWGITEFVKYCSLNESTSAAQTTIICHCPAVCRLEEAWLFWTWLGGSTNWLNQLLLVCLYSSWISKTARMYFAVVTMNVKGNVEISSGLRTDLVTSTHTCWTKQVIGSCSKQEMEQVHCPMGHGGRVDAGRGWGTAMITKLILDRVKDFLNINWYSLWKGALNLLVKVLCVISPPLLSQVYEEACSVCTVHLKLDWDSKLSVQESKTYHFEGSCYQPALVFLLFKELYFPLNDLDST